jgi:hypothetical protein
MRVIGRTSCAERYGGSMTFASAVALIRDLVIIVAGVLWILGVL